jgi:hypothetical protein
LGFNLNKSVGAILRIGSGFGQNKIPYCLESFHEKAMKNNGISLFPMFVISFYFMSLDQRSKLILNRVHH